MLLNFTRRNKLDYEPCELRYKYVPSAFRYDLLKLFYEKLEEGEISVLREYALYRNLSVSINKDHVALYGEDDIHEGYSSDLLIELLRSAQWHEVLSIIEEVVNQRFVSSKQINKLFAYHNVGYEIVKDDSNGTWKVEVKYDAVIAEMSDTEAATKSYPVISALIAGAKAALADPKHIDIETSVSNSMKAIEGYLKEWLSEKGISAATLGDAIKEIKNKKLADANIIESLHQFYIYRNRTPNVGHGSATPSDVTENEALLINEMAASFINYFHRKKDS
ncbi:hypothetical protein [Undibacterium macrobrachii]|uniref:Abortive infection protein-like C-terminal domain-containing protein n=1 Tax=Undibacterium macrobrachii TaxID=1119058 RepID=A0ABQ2XEL2_9BURK|nr:hypothetical protein [Undibacterium macrobrachii]GGX13730.1 hypothetical protein GCM10011282_19820 [Undibacterium macrobrachii]